MPVCQELFNDEILRSFCNSYIHDPQGPVHLLIKGLLESQNKDQLSPSLMGRLLHAQLQWDPKNHILAPLHDAIEYIMQQSPGGEEKRLQMSRIICEAAAERLHWKRNKSLGFVYLQMKAFLNITPVHEEDPTPDDNEYLQNIFSAAIILKNLDIVQSLLKSDQKINVSHDNRYFGRPLQLAAASGCSEVVDLLLAHGADPSVIQLEWNRNVSNIVRPLSEGSALRVAARSGQTQIVHKLLFPKHLESISEFEYFLTILAAADGCHENVVLLLLDMIPEAWKIHSSRYHAQAFIEACHSGCEPLLRSMLASGFNINENKPKLKECLRSAMVHGHANIIRLLLEIGADLKCINIYTCPLRKPVNRGHEEALQVLFDNGVDVNDPAVHNAFVSATGQGQFRILRMLLRLGFDLSRGDNFNGFPPTGVRSLIAAIKCGFVSIVELLASAGVPLNYDDKSYDAVCQAKHRRNDDICAVLFRYGAQDIDLDSSNIFLPVQNYVGYFLPDHATCAWYGKY
jgi:ankyrin repeat protein